MTTFPEQAHETAAATHDAALTFRGVDHVSLTVTNLSISAQFYTEVLGFTVVLDFGYALACMHKTTGFTLSLIRHPDGTGTRLRIGRQDSTIWRLPQGTGRNCWTGSNGFANWTWSSLRSGTANSATT